MVSLSDAGFLVLKIEQLELNVDRLITKQIGQNFLCIINPLSLEILRSDKFDSSKFWISLQRGNKIL